MTTLRHWLSRAMLPIDEWVHEQQWIPDRVAWTFCTVAEISFDWGPDASDWKRNKRWWMPAVYRFFWPGE